MDAQTQMIVTVVGSLVAATAGAFIGAFVAFLLENRRRRGDEIKGHVRNGNLALYSLFTFWDRLEQYSKDVIRPNIERDDLWLYLPIATTGLSIKASEVPDVSFLLGTPHASLYADFHMQVRRFEDNIGLIERRHNILLTRVRPQMGQAGLIEGQFIAADTLKSMIGEDTFAELKQMTEGILENTAENLEDFKLAFADFQGALCEIYPKEKFISVKFGLEGD